MHLFKNSPVIEKQGLIHSLCQRFMDFHTRIGQFLNDCGQVQRWGLDASRYETASWEGNLVNRLNLLVNTSFSLYEDLRRKIHLWNRFQFKYTCSVHVVKWVFLDYCKHVVKAHNQGNRGGKAQSFRNLLGASESFTSGWSCNFYILNLAPNGPLNNNSNLALCFSPRQAAECSCLHYAKNESLFLNRNLLLC